MGADLILLTDCPAKRRLGEGDLLAGNDRLYKLRKQQSQLHAIEALVQRSGKDLATATFTSVLNGPDGPVQREVPLTELRDATAILDELALGCAGCAASGGAGAFGCTSFISYPIPEAAEVWLMRRVQTADTIGGQLLLRAIKDLGYTGAKLKAWRARGLLEAKQPTSAVVKKAFLSSTKVSSDQLLEAIFTLGEPLQPSHCMMLLLFLGALRFDGTAVTSPAQAAALAGLGDGERATRTSLDVGAVSDEPGPAAMQALLRALYLAWTLEDRLWIDA